jgi:hypothetical protein
MKIAVLGCGPAGLMAAHAAAITGAQVACFSRGSGDSPIKSALYGAQYLHAPIPGFEHQPNLVQYELDGDVDGYRTKVYGPRWDGTVSPEELLQAHLAWDIRRTYDWLWDAYGPEVNVVDLNIPKVHDLHVQFDLVINTIPLDALCMRGHTFGFTTIKAAGEAPEIGVQLPYVCEDFIVKCNGEPDVSWYRISNVYGRKTVEWPDSVSPPFSHAVVRKPTFNNCDCWPDMIKAGRYGSWTKGVLSHHAFEATLKELLP